MKFICWSPDEGETAKHAGTFDASSAREAAEEYAKEVYFDGASFFELEVAVARVLDNGTRGEQQMFTVDAEEEVSFSASRVPQDDEEGE